MEIKADLTAKPTIALTSIFVVVCLLFTLFYPFRTVLETALGTSSFLMLLPLLFARIILKDDVANPFSFFGIKNNKEVYICAFALLLTGFFTAFLFSKMSVIALYSSDLATVGMTSISSILLINVLYFIPFFFIFSYFTLGFIPYVYQFLAPKIALFAGSLVFIGLLSPLFDFSFPNTPLWFFIPVLVPMIGFSFFRQLGMVWIIPCLMALINIFYALLF